MDLRKPNLFVQSAAINNYSVFSAFDIPYSSYQASAPEVLTSVEQVNAFLSGQYPEGMFKVTNVSVLGLFPTQDEQGIKIFVPITSAQILV